MKKRKESFNKARNYVLFYGRGNARKLSFYDLAIVEPAGQTNEDLQLMHTTGTLVIAYVSIMEIASYHPMFSLLGENDFLKQNGEFIINRSFDTYFLNLRSKRWIGLLNHQIGKLLYGSGYDGIFLDTIGNVEAPELPPHVKNEQLEAASIFVQNIRRLFPEYLFIQNNGFEQLCLRTGKYIDGICWENPPLAQEDSLEWNEMVISRLKNMHAQHGVRTLLLLDEEMNMQKSGALVKAQSIAEEYNFLYYLAPSQYLSLP